MCMSVCVNAGKGQHINARVCVLALCGISACVSCIIRAGTLPNAGSPSFLQRALMNWLLTGGSKPKAF